MMIFDFVLIFLAAGAIVNAWLLADGPFEGIRGKIVGWAAPTADDPKYATGWEWLANLVQCRTCLSYWMPLILIIIFWLPGLFLTPHWGCIWFIPVYALAATRLTLLIGSLVSYLDIDDPEVDP